MTTKTPWERCALGSLQPWGDAGPLTLLSAASSTSKPSTTGVLSQKSTVTEPWTSSVSPSAVRSTSSSKNFRWLASNGGSARVDWRRPRPTVRSATYGWDKQEPGQSKSVFERALSRKIAMPAMDVGVHSDEERGVTGLGRPRPL